MQFKIKIIWSNAPSLMQFEKQICNNYVKYLSKTVREH